MKTLLIFSDWYLPGDKAGGPIRSLASLVHHLKDDFRIYIFTRNTDYLENTPYLSIQSDVWIFDNNIQLYYCSCANLNSKTIKNTISQIQPDVIYLNSMYSFYFTLLPLYFSNNTAVVLAPRGMLASGALSIKSAKKKFFLLLAKTIHLFKKVVFHATNNQERQDILNYFPSNIIEVIPNIPHNRGLKNSTIKNKESKHLRLVFIGRIAKEKNVLFAAEILSQINFPVEIDFYGAIYDETYWEECKQLLQANKFIKWNYKGIYANSNFESIISDYHALFLPTLGENYGHAIVECLSAGVPVIISDKTPWVDISHYNAGWAISLSDKEKFKSVLLDLYTMDNVDYQKYVVGAKNYFKNRVVNSASVKKYIDLFKYIKTY